MNSLRLLSSSSFFLISSILFLFESSTSWASGLGEDLDEEEGVGSLNSFLIVDGCLSWTNLGGDTLGLFGVDICLIMTFLGVGSTFFGVGETDLDFGEGIGDGVSLIDSSIYCSGVLRGGSKSSIEGTSSDKDRLFSIKLSTT